MKKILYLLISVLFISCHNGNSYRYKLEAKIDSLQMVCEKYELLKDTLEMLKYPADQRLSKSLSLIKNGDLDKAKSELDLLKQLFPNSLEATKCSELYAKISDLKKKKQLEEERIKSLGFKAIKQKQNFKIDYNQIKISNISIKNKFVFDVYSDYNTPYLGAERGNDFIVMNVTVKSESKEPKLPEFAVYQIKGDKMFFVKTFMTKYARWSDVLCYTGTYNDINNDFKKTSSVKFALGCEVSESLTSSVFAIVAMNKNVLTEDSSWSNPPKKWVGSANYPKQLNIDAFSKDYTLIKCFNLK